MAVSAAQVNSNLNCELTNVLPLIHESFGISGVSRDHIVHLAVKGDLLRTLEKLIQRIDKIDGIIVETTGLASPGVLINMLLVEASLKDYMKLNNVVTTLDAVHFIEQLGDADIKDKVNNKGLRFHRIISSIAFGQ